MRFLDVGAKLRLHWKDKIWLLVASYDSYHGSKTCRLLNLRKNHLAGWFFRFWD